jgi:hypothetical protein
LVLTLFVAFWGAHARAQENAAVAETDLTPETLRVAKDLSENTGIPLSTALTDLVTQSASL